MPPRLLTSRDDPIAGDLGQDRAHQAVNQGIRRLDRHAADTGFAVDSQAQLDLRLTQRKAGLAGRGDRAGRQRNPHRPDGGGRVSGLGGDLGQARARLGHRAGDFVDQDRAGEAATARVPATAGQRDVIGHDHHIDRNPLGPRALGGQAEVEPISGVVLDDQEGPSRARDGPDRGEDGIGSRRREHIPRHRRAEHPPADVARMGRLVPAAAAGDEAHLSVSYLFGIGPDQDRLARQSSQAGMDRDQPLEHLFHDAVRIVDELLHRKGLPFDLDQKMGRKPRLNGKIESMARSPSSRIDPVPGR